MARRREGSVSRKWRASFYVGGWGPSLGDRDEGRAAHPSGAGRAAEVTVAVDTRTAATARSFVTATLHSWGLGGPVGAAAAVVDQFVEAARRQGSPLVDVRVCRTGSGVRVEVIERSHPPTDDLATGAEGPTAAVLDGLSNAWGCLAIGSASCLWADIPRGA